jgi:hypothetical protein
MNLSRVGRRLAVSLKSKVTSTASRHSGSASKLLMRSAPIATQLLSLAAPTPFGLIGMTIGDCSLEEIEEEGEAEEPR